MAGVFLRRIAEVAIEKQRRERQGGRVGLKILLRRRGDGVRHRALRQHGLQPGALRRGVV